MSRLTSFLLAALTISSLRAGPPTVTIYSPTAHEQEVNYYNDKGRGFAVIRDTVSLDLHQGDNDVLCPTVSPLVDPASIMLRDPSGKADFRVVLQKYLGNVLTEQAMLTRFEGQTIPFEVFEGDQKRQVMGKIIRAGYWQRGGGSVEEMAQPIVEVDGQFYFKTPGTPIFPKLAEGEILKPELRWKINAAKAVKADVELVYVTDGLAWGADYNAIVGEDGKISQLTGWITLDNDTGVRFENCQLKLIAGNVKRVRGALDRRGPSESGYERVVVTGSNIPTAEETGPAIERQTFDEYHEYTVPFPLTLADREMTQVELVRATNVNATRSFIYDGSKVSGDTWDYARLDSSFGTDSNSKVAIISEFKNDAQNHLGVPLPGGQVHFYRADAQGHLLFSGDSKMDNTPKDELVRAAVGYAFDLVGQRRQLDFQINEEAKTADESYEVVLRNHRDKAADVRILEHACRWRQWEITAKSDPFKKVDQQAFEFVVPVPGNGEKKLTYTIRYTQLPESRR